jgi:four helix bundle protein
LALLEQEPPVTARIQSHRDLAAWQKSIDLVEEVYRLTTRFPREEQYGLVSQLREATVSIPTNIAEGRGRSGVKEYHRFVCISRGSANEVDTLLEIAERLAFANAQRLERPRAMLDDTSRLVTTLARSLRR